MSFYGIRVSKKTKDADTESLKDLVFDSDTEVLKTIKSGVKNLTISSGSGTVNIYHGLGYYPTFLIYYTDGSGYFIDSPDVFSTDYGRLSSSVDVGAKTTTTALTITGKGTDGTYKVFYEIFENGGYR